MKPLFRSFRWRLAVLSALLAGLALAGFAATAAWWIRDANRGRLDGELRAQAQRAVIRPPPREGWEVYERTMQSLLNAHESADLLLLVTDQEGHIDYRSPAWPAEADPAQLSWPPVPPRPTDANDNPPPFSHDRPWPPPPRDHDFRRPPPRPDEYGRRPPPGQHPGDHPLPRPPPSSVILTTLNTSVGAYRIALASSPHAHLALGVHFTVIHQNMAAVRTAFLIAIPLALVLIGLGAGFLSHRALRPIQRLTATVRKVTAQGLDQRIALMEEDQEFAELIDVFNAMLERLERSFMQASRFSADAAHELKTPLAILQGQIERAIQDAESGSTQQAQLASILDEVRRLAIVSRKLLLLSQADAGRLRLQRAPFNLSAALDELLEDARMLGPTLDMTGEIAPDLIVQADANLLRQVLYNLISNALKYNLENGWIRMSATKSADRIEMMVANASPGIPAADRDRIFERFYRADPARSREIEGFGLGLSVSREIARAHGGDLLLQAAPDHETRFILILPADYRFSR
ncbi:MAG: two-component system, OmpR family, heavy metal sensor histidine kinase CusS [Pseudomonadota bacterium]|nr:two-component system, OmpR family, heavy metal sensor histidine kinase CusS [Pseudomonadota bacterium]